MATFADLKTRAQNMALTEDDTLAGIFVNDAYRDLVVQAQLLCTNSVESLTQGQNLYTLSGFGITNLGMIQYIIYRAAGQTDGYILEPSDLESVLQLSSTNPTGYIRKYALQGLDNLYVWPASQQTGDSLIIYYAQNPLLLVDTVVDPLVEESSPSSVPSQWQHMISVAAAARLSDAVGEDVTLSQALQNRYEIMYSMFTKWVNGRQGRGTRMMPSGYARSTGMPQHDRSAYYSSVDSY
jgi:hypothetical protein